MNCFLDHIAINMIHEDAMVAFYRDVLGFPAERLDAYRAGQVPFPSFRLTRDTIIDLFPRKMWGSAPSAGLQACRFNHFCYTLTKSDWDELRERLNVSGTTEEEGPVQRWGAHGDAISVYFRDPDGNVIEARYYPEEEDN